MTSNGVLRRLLVMLLLLAMVVSVTACGGEKNAGSTAEPTGTHDASESTGAAPTQSSHPTKAPATSGGHTTTVPTKTPQASGSTIKPALTENEKPDVIEADSKYANVKVYDKFGKWPLKTGKEYYSSDVGTWFTIWWMNKGEVSYDFHWFQECRLKPVDYGYYASNNVDYLTSVFARLKYIGIDFLLLDDTNGHWNDTGLISRNMTAILRVASKDGAYAPKIAIATGAPLREGNTAQQQKEYDQYGKFYTKFKSAFYHYGGKPLLVNYIAGVANARYSDNQNRFTIRYGTGLISWQKNASNQSIFKTQGNWGWVFDMQNPGSEIMGVQPGYNKPGMESSVVKREGGKHYIEQWLAAIKANPKVIMIPSYNDHCEETGWEATTPVKKAGTGLDQVPAGEDPYLYEKITEAYMALRYGYIDGFFYKVENTTQVYQYKNGGLKKVAASAAGKNPIILLPQGYIEWEKNR